MARFKTARAMRMVAVALPLLGQMLWLGGGQAAGADEAQRVLETLP